MIVTTLATIFLFDLQSSFMFFVAIAMICTSILMYNHEEHRHDPAGADARRQLSQMYPYFAVLLYIFVVVGGLGGIAQVHMQSETLHVKGYVHKTGLH